MASQESFFAQPELWVAVAFVGFIALTWKPISTAIVGQLDARSEKIRKDIDEAQRLREEAQALLAEYQRKHKEAIGEAGQIIARAKSEADRLQRDAKAQLEVEIKRREEQAMQRIAQAEQSATQDVRAAAVEVALNATRRLLEEKLDPAAQARLIDTAIRELPGKLN
ncbi:MAG: F0F1 ATP synthase subunit B [Alphaproteobacteria bacterium]|nr:F0F1 ATP synthase subunit B [Alphaproteobacteria bacterium]